MKQKIKIKKTYSNNAGSAGENKQKSIAAIFSSVGS
jgi:hypothetical protein